MIRLAAYERTSKDEAEPQRQRDSINHFSEQRGWPVSRYYRDVGGRRHEALDQVKRPEWNRLLADVRSGQYDAIVVEETTRLGFQDEWALMSLCHELRQHRVALYEAKSDRLLNGDSIADFLQTGVAGHSSRKEVEQIATRVLGNKIARVRDTGSFQGGAVPHGLCLECRGPSGAARWTIEIAPDGRRIQEYPDGTVVWHDHDHIPGRAPVELLYLVPSKRYPERVEHVRMAARWFLVERTSFGAIARRLNDAGAYPAGSTPWYSARVQSMLETATYTGYATFGRKRRGRYAVAKDGRPAPSDGTKGKNPVEEWTWSKEPVFSPPIIPREDWGAIQAKMAEEKAGPRRGKNPELILSGLVYCGCCGTRMAGSVIIREGKETRTIYQCAEYLRHHGHPPSGCRANQTRQDLLLEYVETWLEETGLVLAETAGDTEEALLRAMYSEQAPAREGLREARKALEDWLAEALLLVADAEPTPDGRRRFRIGEWDLTLPGCDDALPTLLEVYTWLARGVEGRNRERLAELEADHDRITRALLLAPTKRTRDKILAEVGRVEAEMSHLASGGTGLTARVRGLMADLNATYRRLKLARRELASGDLRRRAKAIYDLIERIELTHRLVPRGKDSVHLVARLESVRIVPRDGSSERNVPWGASLTVALLARTYCCSSERS